MALTNTQYDAVMRLYSARQTRDARELEQHRETAYAAIPRLAEIDAELASASVRKARALLAGGAEKDLSIDLAARGREATEERRALLLTHGYPADYLDMHYTCPLCRDTGYVDSQKCTCFRQAEIQLLYADARLAASSPDAERFASFSLDYYRGDVVNPSSGLSELAEARRALQAARGFCANFDALARAGKPDNLFLYGDVGTGKTFLSRAIARELLQAGKSVLYLTSYHLFEALGEQRFSANSAAKGAEEAFFSCDLLLIDDLGTEMLNNFVSSELFLLVNERLLQKKATVISTNLSLQRFRDAFSERTFSRILGAYQLLHLSGQDIRIQKRTSGGH